MPYRFEHNRSYMLNNKKYVIKENLMDGEEKGLAFTFLKKEGDKFLRITVNETSKDNFVMKKKIDEETETSETIDLKAFKKLLKDNKHLDFVKTYFENERGKYKGLEDNETELFGGKKKVSKKKVSKKKVTKKKVSKKKVSKKKSSKKSY